MIIDLEFFERTLRPFFERKGLTITLNEPNDVTVVNSSGVTVQFRPDSNTGFFGELERAAAKQKPKLFPEDAPV